MGKIITIANQKGGAGKTSCAVNFLYWCNLNHGKALLIDADSQESSSNWIKTKELVKIEKDPDSLFELAQQEIEEYDFVIIDCPGGLGEVSKSAIYCADLVLIPLQPGVLDISSANKTLTHVKHAQKIRKDNTPMALAFISRATKGTKALKEAQEYLSSQPHINLASTVIFQRQFLQDLPKYQCSTFEMPGTAAKEVSKMYNSLFEEALSFIN